MASTMGKVYHRIVRTKLLPSLDAYKGPLQAGTSPWHWGRYGCPYGTFIHGAVCAARLHGGGDVL